MWGEFPICQEIRDRQVGNLPHINSAVTIAEAYLSSPCSTSRWITEFGMEALVGKRGGEKLFLFSGADIPVYLNNGRQECLPHEENENRISVSEEHGRLTA